jgi:hypothetical protein
MSLPSVSESERWTSVKTSSSTTGKKLRRRYVTYSKKTNSKYIPVVLQFLYFLYGIHIFNKDKKAIEHEIFIEIIISYPFICPCRGKASTSGSPQAVANGMRTMTTLMRRSRLSAIG